MAHSFSRLAIVAVVAFSFCARQGVAEESVSLFDGKTLSGWDVLTCEAEVSEGAVLLKEGNGLVQTKKQYSDYVFECEWKALRPESWDSGIYFRYTEVPKGRPWPNGYQVNMRKGMEGNLGGFADAKNKVPIKAGDWNRFELTVKGTKASLKVNGKKAWSVDGIKVPKGFIALQAETPGGGQFLFRKIRIKELSK